MKTEPPDEARSRTMRAVRSKDTKPELKLRQLLHGAGYRFRLHRKDLPGSPDLVFSGRKAVIFVHGCFWHSHNCKRGARIPKTNGEYWKAKIARNIGRDANAQAALKSAGWRFYVVWECQLNDAQTVLAHVSSFLGPLVREGDSLLAKMEVVRMRPCEDVLAPAPGRRTAMLSG